MENTTLSYEKKFLGVLVGGAVGDSIGELAAVHIAKESLQDWLNEGDTLRDLISRAGGLKKNAYIYGAALFREKAQEQEQLFAQLNYADSVNFIISNAGKTNNFNKKIVKVFSS